MLDERAGQIADNAATGKPPSFDDVVFLLGFDTLSLEAEYVRAKAREIGLQACGGRGYVHAQIGVDAQPCPENCLFCSFAAVNISLRDYDPECAVVPVERIVHYAKLFDAAGVDLVSLMATAALDFDSYLDMVRAVRANVSDDIVIMANAGDLSPEQARALRDAGAGAAYHALRLGEGELTDVEPDVRRRTMRHIREAGLSLMTGVEPVWHGIDPYELAERICEIPSFEPFCTGACALTQVQGADVAGKLPASREFVQYVGALTRLACGQAVPIGGIGGVAWVDAGCDPRNRGYGEADDELREKVASAKRRLERDGFILG